MSATTPTGIPVPTLGDDPNVPRDMLALGTFLDKVTSPKFTTLLALTTGLPSPGLGQLASAGGIGYIWDGTQWQATPTVPPMRQVPTNSTQVIANGVFTILGLDSTDPAVRVRSAAATGQPNTTSLQINDASAPWNAFVSASWAASGTGRRIIGISVQPPGQPVPGGPSTNLSASAAANLGGLQQAYFPEFDAPAGSRVQMWVYQDSGANLAVSSRILRIARVY